MSSARKPKTIDPDKVDPSVYYYDEVYDCMKQEEKNEQSKGRQESSVGDKHRGSKYIDGLKETAELRRTEKELRKFKRYAKDREEAEAEGDISGDVYISDSYKRKLAEIKQLEEEKRRRYQRDQDKTMNFVKNSSKKDKSESNRSRRRGHKSPESRPSPDNCQKSTRSSQEIRDVDERSDKREPTAQTMKRKKPKNIEERRKYLREVLKKRTVGKVYDEAVQRYMQRKALSQR